MTSDATVSGLNRELPEDRSFFGHPQALGYIVFTEAWERFSFYGMQALLVLYMASHLLHPGAVEGVIAFAGFRAAIESLFGPLSIQALATQIFGLYVGLIYFMPVIGGFLGDRYLGQRGAVILGAGLMAVGHFLMAFEAVFLFALLALIFGAGLLKGNLAAQVGRLYEKTDQRRDRAFSLYSMAINVGAAIAPLVCGTLGEIYGWHYGFGAAGIGMLIGIFIYLSGRDYLPPDRIGAAAREKVALVPGDGRIILALLVMFVIVTLYWTAQAQVWNTYPLWVREHVDREIFGFTVLVTWFQSLDSIAVLVLAPLVMLFWAHQSRRGVEPGDMTKVLIGLVIFAAACFWLGLGELLAGAHKLHLVWPFVFHFICAIGYLYIAPIMLALTSRSAPAGVNAMMVGASYLSIFAGGIASGWLGRFYERLPASEFWGLHGLIVACGAVLILILRRPLVRILQPKP